jgi:hypothetical protein
LIVLALKVGFTSIYGVECFKRQELCKLCLDYRYDLLWTQYQKAHKRRETLRSCEDYRHTRSYIIYHAIRNVDISLSGSCEYPVTTIDLGMELACPPLDQ